MSESAEPPSIGAESFEPSECDDGLAAPANLDDAPERPLPFLLWPMYLLFRPTEFFRRVGRSAPEGVTMMAVYFAGVATVAGRVTPEPAENGAGTLTSIGATKTWVAYWLTMLIGGIFSAPLQYLIGGWWHKCRVVWSGAENPDGFLTRRVLYFSRQLFVVPLLAIIALETVKYETPLEAEQADDVVLLYLFAIVFVFWSCIANYKGVRALFDVGRKRAIVWFLVLPWLLYGAAFGVIGAAAYFEELESPPPATSRPLRFASDLAEFRYPGNWWLDKDHASFNPTSYIPIESNGVFFELILYDSYVAAEEELAYSIEIIREEFGEVTIISEFDTWGPLTGVGVLLNAPLPDDALVARIFVTEFGEDVMFEVQERSLASLESQSFRGFRQIEGTFKLRIPLPEEGDPAATEDAPPDY